MTQANFAKATDSQARLQKLVELWEREKLATRRQEQDLRDALPFAQRLSRGLALDQLRYENTEGAGAGQCQLWFHLKSEGVLERVQINVGDPVVLWSEAQPQRQRAVVGRRGQTRISLLVPQDYARFVEFGPINLDRETSEVTFERGAAALECFLADAKLAVLRELLFGSEEPVFGNCPPVSFRDTQLNQSQKDAVSLTLRAEQVALVHGPPGTGKTRTLVEVIRQQLLLGRRVLVTAASNTAVDHLARQLLARGVKPLRLGHPARVAEDLRPRTREALMEGTEEYRLARQWQSEARALRERHQKLRAGRGRGFRSGRELLLQANRLNADATGSLNEARDKVLRRARVVCTTAAGADASLLGSARFDMVVLDEATQAPDPIALAALQRGGIAVLAGDPCQLSPTVVDATAAREGLSSTIFERASRRWKPEATHLLSVQYRMNSALMRFPSESMYQGRLVAHPSVANSLLEELSGIAPDAGRACWTLLDTAGTGWEEQVDPETSSTFNTKQAERTALEVQRVIARGLQPRDVAAITPYAAQVRLLQQLLTDEVARGLEIGSVDGFQGREKEAVVVDLVRSNAAGSLGFLTDVRRTNVALTRAKRYLVVVCDSSTLTLHPYYRELLAAAEHDGVWQTCC